MRTILTICFGFALAASAQTNLVSTNADEQRLLKAIPQLLWTEHSMISTDWVKPEQKVREKANYFSDKHYKFWGLTGEVQFLFTDHTLNDFSFYIPDGEVGTSADSDAVGHRF